MKIYGPQGPPGPQGQPGPPGPQGPPGPGVQAPPPAKTLAHHVLLWLVFVALVALLPLVAAALLAWIPGEPVKLSQLLAEGDGLLVVVAITADAIGRALDRKKADDYASVLCGVVLCFSLIAFVTVKRQILDYKAKVEQTVGISDKSNLDERLKAWESLSAERDKQSSLDDRITRLSCIFIVLGLSNAFRVIIITK